MNKHQYNKIYELKLENARNEAEKACKLQLINQIPDTDRKKRIKKYLIKKEMKTIFKTKNDLLMFIHWIIVLKMEIIPKTTKRLEDENGCCCLGVGCYVTIPSKKLVTENNQLIGTHPQLENNAPDWLINININFSKRYGNSLTFLNDAEKLTHSQIADALIEAYKPELGEYYNELKETFKRK